MDVTSSITDQLVKEVDGNDDGVTPAPSPPRPAKRRKLSKKAIVPDIDVESEDEQPPAALGQVPVSVRTEKRKTEEDDEPIDPTAELVTAPKKKRKISSKASRSVAETLDLVVSASEPVDVETSMGLDADAEADAMLLEHLDTAPERKRRKSGGRKKVDMVEVRTDPDVEIETAVASPVPEVLSGAIKVIDEDEVRPLLEDSIKIEKRTKKRSGGPPKRKKSATVVPTPRLSPTPPLGPPPNPFDITLLGADTFEEDLYYLHEGLRRQHAGLTVFVEPDEPLDEETPVQRHPSIRVNATGSARTEGYYKIPDTVKSHYIENRNKMVGEVPAGASNGRKVTLPKTPAAPAGVSSRSTRVESRRLAQNVEQANKYFTQLSGADADHSLKFSFNQLRTRKKKLKFARSPIHDWGLYAMEAISAGEMVIEYVGEVIRQQVADKREKYYERTGIGSSYLFRVDDDAVVDATKKGNLGYDLSLRLSEGEVETD
jgi:histone-lysine N-methyltransferase SETD1